ncbi:hypothetical protein GGF50DRAFT_64025 [Schizophyllum commune]
MDEPQDYFDVETCDLSGATEDLSFCRLIPLDAVQDDELNVARQEWVYGLQRGGLSLYLKSRANTMVFRQDITKMFCRGEFILVPTFRTYLDAMAFLEQGVKSCNEKFRSRRRPLTAMRSRRGLYRYVFIAFTDAARALQDEFHLQPQTQDDLNGGIFPLDNTPILEGTDGFPVLECRAHPFSISVGADKILWKRGTELTGQWHNLIGQLMEHWIFDVINPPQWFLDGPEFEYDDVEFTPSQASGYALPSLNGEPEPEPFALLNDATVPETDYRKVVADWTYNKVIYKHPPPEEKPVRTEYKKRRSARLHKCPYDRDGPPPSPTRKGPRALLTCRRNYEILPPSWAARSAGFPTHTFTSNDWAYFQYGVYLPGSMKR